MRLTCRWGLRQGVGVGWAALVAVAALHCTEGRRSPPLIADVSERPPTLTDASVPSTPPADARAVEGPSPAGTPPRTADECASDLACWSSSFARRAWLEWELLPYRIAQTLVDRRIADLEGEIRTLESEMGEEREEILRRLRHGCLPGLDDSPDCRRTLLLDPSVAPDFDPMELPMRMRYKILQERVDQLRWHR